MSNSSPAPGQPVEGGIPSDALGDDLVPDSVIPHQTLPPLRYRELPEAPHWTKMLGPSIILAGLSLGSGEFIFWPYITYKSGFTFFWACMVGVLTQFFINMEIERWTLATGESAITGFCRLSRQWAWIMLLLNFIPWIWPGWATGAGTLVSWTVFGAVPTATETLESPFTETITLPGAMTLDSRKQTLEYRGVMSAQQRDHLLALSNHNGFHTAVESLFLKLQSSKGVTYSAPFAAYIAIATLILVGVVLTTGPVVYNTVERLQTWLVAIIFVIAILLGILFIRFDAVVAMARGIVNIGVMPDASSGLGVMALLGALAFAGAGGTMNLGQSNFIKDKGYGMGKYIGRITSPLTGNEEAIADTGFHFRHTPENMARWRRWWRAANFEHFWSFYGTCVVCLVLLSLVAYSLLRNPDGSLKPGMDRFGQDMNFVWGESQEIGSAFGMVGPVLKLLFLVMGIAILLTTELGVLDAVSRIGADILKVNYLRENPRWPLGRLYFLLLWTMILTGSAILLASSAFPNFKQPLFLLKTAAAMNGGVMMIYSLLLLYLNTKILSRSLSISPLRFVAMVWACAFFGYFTIQAIQLEVIPWMKEMVMWLLG